MTTMQVFQGVELILDENIPLIRDTELAQKLGYVRVRDIRKLILRHLPFLQGIRTRSTVERVVRQGRGEVLITVTEYLLTEAEAVYVAAKSNTVAANALLQRVIKGFFEAKAWILDLVMQPLGAAQRELEELREMYRQDMEEKNKQLAEARSAPAMIPIPAPGERTMITVTNHVDTSDGLRLFEVQKLFGLPTKGKNAQLARVVAQQMGFWNNPEMVYITKVDTRGGDTFNRPSRKYRPACILAMAHTLIRRARALNCTVPASTLAKYGDPALSDSPVVTYEDGIPTIHPVRSGVVTPFRRRR